MSTRKSKSSKIIISYQELIGEVNENNKMLQRVYGISFPKKSQLEDILKFIRRSKRKRS